MTCDSDTSDNICRVLYEVLLKLDEFNFAYPNGSHMEQKLKLNPIVIR